MTQERLVASQMKSCGHTYIDIYPGLALVLQYTLSQYWRNLSNLIPQIFCGIRSSKLLTRRNEPVDHISNY